MRKLASVKRVDEIKPITNADAIEVAVFGGWKVVVQKGEYKAGDLAIYVEVDSFVPHVLAPFLSKGKEPKVYNGVEGQRLKTIRLRGQLSQGLVLSLSHLPNFYWEGSSYNEGDDVSEVLNITKWEPPVTGMSSEATKGQFPSFLQKTDQERIQNLTNEYADWKNKDTWIWTEKLDGTSFTAYYLDGEFGVCSRNLELRLEEPSLYTQVANTYNLKKKMEELGLNIAIQGEVLGQKVQKNKYGFTNYQLYLFDVYDIVKGEYVSYDTFQTIAGKLGVLTVPVVNTAPLPDTVDELLLLADGQSVVGSQPIREGFVIKHPYNTTSFKVISNEFLLKGE
jgi:RNA ligase (TIGR02306 family)